MPNIELARSSKKSNIQHFPTLGKTMISAKGLKKKLLPVLKFDGGVVDAKWEGLPFTFFVQNVFVDQIDFQLEKGKYVLLDPLDLEEIEELEEIEVERGHLKVGVGKEMKVKYKMTQAYGPEGQLLSEGDYWHGKHSKVEYAYEAIAGVALPVKKIRSIGFDGKAWWPVQTMEYQYDEQGFLKGYRYKVEAQEVEVLEELVYAPNGKDLTVRKAHLSEDWKVVIRERKEGGYDVENDGAIYGYKPTAERKSIALRFAVSHFQDIFRSVLKYTFKVGPENNLSAEFAGDGDLPTQVRYQFRALEREEQTEVQVKALGPDHYSVTDLEWERTFDLKRDGNAILVEEKKGDRVKEKRFESSRSWPELVAMVALRVPFFEDDFEKEQETYAFDGSRVVPPTYRYEYLNTGDQTLRKCFALEERKEQREATLRTGEPQWLQTEATPVDPSGAEMEFVAQLDHPSVFGSYFLFYSESHALISQVFQCT